MLLPELRTWDDALSYLTRLVEARAKAKPNEPIVLFFDELPWLATARSRLLESLDYHWNRRLSQIDQVKVILCGSAASWMLRRIVHAKGGLHNRLTRRMRLEPFTLAETNAYLRAKRIRLKPMELMELYMAIGGVPYYLSLVERGRSVAEIIGALCVERGSPLQTEFDDVFASLFSDHDQHIAILRALSKRREGLTRNEILAETGLSSGGGANRMLQELEEAGFVARAEPYGAKKKNTVYRVIDEYTLFYLAWIERAPKGVLARGGANHWRSRSQTPSYRSWTGYTFESLCLKHASELMRALDIDKLVTAVGTWRLVSKTKTAKRGGAQADLLFERRDGVINLCEMKFSETPFVVTKAYARSLKERSRSSSATRRRRSGSCSRLLRPWGSSPTRGPKI